MKVYKGFSELMLNLDHLPVVGWIFVDSTVDRTSKDVVSSAFFYVAEDDFEEIAFEDTKRTFVECPTMLDIKSVADRSTTKPDLNKYLEATLYYLENDDFQG
ncbi:hypothetical protein [Pseudomonas sp. MAG733B]|uniref:hypothetical protein n=1 Tax=Pseudomonas sp. MAG733B TaxID=3122079 RepID=UPI000FC23C01